MSVGWRTLHAPGQAVDRLYAGSGLTYPRRVSLARGDGDLLNVVGARIVGNRVVAGGCCRGSSSET